MREDIFRCFFDGEFKVHEYAVEHALTKAAALLDCICIADRSHHCSVLIFTFTSQVGVHKWHCYIFAINSFPSTNPENCK